MIEGRLIIIKSDPISLSVFCYYFFLCVGEHAVAKAAASDQQHVPEREGHADRAAQPDQDLASTEQTHFILW